MYGCFFYATDSEETTTPPYIIMELINIIPSDSKLWEQAWRLYTESFPEHERRRISSHVRAVEDPDFHTEVAIENGNLLAILFYWTTGSGMVYIEHIAVNPQMRGRGIGSDILCDFMARNRKRTVLLEIDPPVDITSEQRLAFYERSGFRNTGFVFNHPSYQKNGLCHDLLVLAHTSDISGEEYARFVEFLQNKVLRYID